MDRKKLEQLLRKYFQGSIAPEDKEQLHEYYHSAKTEKLSEKDYSVEQKKALQAEIWASVQSHIKQHQANNRWVFWQSKTYWGIAASILLILGSFFALRLLESEPISPRKNWVTVKAESGKKMKVVLPDSSTIFLNSESNIRYEAKFAGNTREIWLEGEAFFEVAHNPQKPFIVHTAYFNTSVLGTSFNIVADSIGQTSVAVVTGKVQVDLADNEVESILLTPNMKASIEPVSNQIKITSEDLYAFTAWKDGILIFDSTPMQEVVKKLSKWYGVSIRVKNKELEEIHITGTYNNQSITHVLASFQHMTGLNYGENPDGSYWIGNEK